MSHCLFKPMTKLTKIFISIICLKAFSDNDAVYRHAIYFLTTFCTIQHALSWDLELATSRAKPSMHKGVDVTVAINEAVRGKKPCYLKSRPWFPSCQAQRQVFFITQHTGKISFHAFIKLKHMLFRGQLFSLFSISQFF